MMRKRIPYWVVALFVIVVVAVAGTVLYAVTRLGRTSITAYFDTSVGVSAGTDVRILGVTVGSVDKVLPKGDVVEVTMHVDRGVKVPADAKAAQVTPSVVPDRTVQLLPAYTDGPEMLDGSVIPRERTSTPVEVDRLYKSIADLSTALGPKGANKNGALSGAIDATAKTLGDNGAAVGRSIDEMSTAARALADKRTDLADTVVNLQSFVGMLRQNDQQVRQFNDQMAGFNRTLAVQRSDIQGALRDVSLALADVARLVRDNQGRLKTNIDRLATISQITSDERASVADILTTAPVALTNLIDAYDPESGSLHMRANLPELQNPAGVLCKLMATGRLNPGDPNLKAFEDPKGIAACQAAENDRNAEIERANPQLPLGILQGEMMQSVPVEGTVPGTPGYTQRPASEGGR